MHNGEIAFIGLIIVLIAVGFIVSVFQSRFIDALNKQLSALLDRPTIKPAWGNGTNCVSGTYGGYSTSFEWRKYPKTMFGEKVSLKIKFDNLSITDLGMDGHQPAASEERSATGILWTELSATPNLQKIAFKGGVLELEMEWTQIPLDARAPSLKNSPVYPRLQAGQLAQETKAILDKSLKILQSSSHSK